MRRSWIDTQSTIFQPDGESLPLNIRIGVLLRAGLHLYQNLFSKWVKMCGRVKRAHQANSVFEVRQLALGVPKIGLRLMQPDQRQTQIISFKLLNLIKPTTALQACPFQGWRTWCWCRRSACRRGSCQTSCCTPRQSSSSRSSSPFIAIGVSFGWKWSYSAILVQPECDRLDEVEDLTGKKSKLKIHKKALLYVTLVGPRICRTLST